MAVKRWNGTSWDTYSASPNLNNTLSQWKKTAAGGETTLSGNDDSSINLAYTVGQESVYINGVLQVRGSDYTATNGSSIVLTNQLVAGNIVQVISPLLLPMSSVIPLSTIAAKGDLMIGTASSVPARLPIGANDQVLVADNTSSNGMAWKGFAKQSNNAVINGAFDIWQRGTASQTPNNNSQINTDRWVYYGDNGGSVLTQDTDVPTNPYFQYSLKSVVASTNSFSIGQKIEAANAINFAGQTVTFSFWAKTTSGTATMYANAYYPSAKDNFASLTLIASNTMTTPNSTWTRYATTFTLPSNVQNGLMILIGRGATANTSYYTGIQLELGSTATPFSRAGGDIQGELAKCQRYFYRVGTTSQNYGAFGTVFPYSSTACLALIQNPTTMRSKATSITWTNIRAQEPWTGYIAFTALSVEANYTTPFMTVLAGTIGSASFVTGKSYFIAQDNNSGGYIDINAEL